MDCKISGHYLEHLVMELNPMISRCMIKIFKNFNGEALIAEIEEYLTNNTL